jgi:ligand-binding sensor domain-containing protein
MQATITDLTVDAHDDLWSEGGADDSYTFSHIRDFKVVDQFVRPLTPMLLALAADPGGRVWIAGDLIETSQGHHQLASFKQRADYGYIRNMVFDSSSSFWGASTGALVGWRKGKLQYLTVRNGLPCDRINTLVIDDNKALWLYAQCGLIEISRRELEHWWNSPDSVVKTTMFDALDGVDAAPSPFRPSAAKSRDGRLWFANGSLLQMIDPNHLEKNTVPPPVLVERLFVDGKSYVSPGLKRPQSARLCS